MDLDLLALEGRLSLLDAQHELNVIRCEKVVTRLQSFLREGDSDVDELRHDSREVPQGRRNAASRFNTAGEPDENRELLVPKIRRG
ncbi:hypothetical protein CLOP_g17226 [Closterium sp. NIES-67]|nr:hypothetical protein CLOP_g17226 [Closterium sp. NIES-67]